MSEITEYFARHYALVINNDQGSYNAACEVIRRVTRASGVTASQYRSMTDSERRTGFAMEIGSGILDMVREACEEVTDKHAGSLGALLISEAMNYSGGDLQWTLGATFLPEDQEADEYFDEEADSE